MRDDVFPDGLLLSPVRAMAWTDAPPIDALDIAQFDDLLTLDPAPEFMLLGTGAGLRQPPRPFVRALEMQADGGRHLEYERARCLVKLGDWDDLPLLVSGLRDEGLMCRAQCFKALREATHLSHGFYPQGEEDEREAAVQAWEAWLADRASDEI